MTSTTSIASPQSLMNQFISSIHTDKEALKPHLSSKFKVTGNLTTKERTYGHKDYSIKTTPCDSLETLLEKVRTIFKNAIGENESPYTLLDNIDTITFQKTSKIIERVAPYGVPRESHMGNEIRTIVLKFTFEVESNTLKIASIHIEDTTARDHKCTIL